MSLEDQADRMRVRNVRFDDRSLIVELEDGRTVSAPLAWFPRLAGASREQLENWHLAAAGHGLHWPDIDEDIGISGLLRQSKELR